MKRLFILPFILVSFACTEEQEPEPSTHYLEITAEGQKFRQEYSKNLSFDEAPASVFGDKSSDIVQLGAANSNKCLKPPCLSLFYANMIFSSKIGSSEAEMIEALQLPSGDYSTISSSNGSTKVFMKIIEADDTKGIIHGTFIGEVFKNPWTTPTKVSIKGEFYLPYKVY